jgi:AraC-like DNA-binding protein
MPMDEHLHALGLGFEELNSFSRAFVGWEGATPSRWREKHAGPSST